MKPSHAFRFAYRLPLLLWHVAIDLPITLVFMLGPFHRLRVGGEPLDHRMIRWWQGGLMRIFGFRMHRRGTPLPGAMLFVAKREISKWPMVGWLASQGETIFHERGSSESMGGVLHEMLARLRAGRSVGVFPEGRTRNGHGIGPFHARIFLAAVEAGVRVQPVALRYGPRASAQTVVAFAPGESFAGNFLRLLGEPARDTEVWFLDPIDTSDAGGRRRIAETARDRIVAAMESP